MTTESEHTQWVPTGFEGTGFEEDDYIYEGDDQLIAGGRKSKYIRRTGRRSNGRRKTKVKRKSKHFKTKRRRSPLRGTARLFAI